MVSVHWMSTQRTASCLVWTHLSFMGVFLPIYENIYLLWEYSYLFMKAFIFYGSILTYLWKIYLLWEYSYLFMKAFIFYGSILTYLWKHLSFMGVFLPIYEKIYLLWEYSYLFVKNNTKCTQWFNVFTLYSVQWLIRNHCELLSNSPTRP